MTNKSTGKYGEDVASDFLTKNGYKIIEKNFKYSKIAEIDIIALKNNILHFVEVKTRTTSDFGNPLEAVNKTKLNSIYKAACFYINKNGYKKFQIDVIGIILKDNSIQFIENIALN